MNLSDIIEKFDAKTFVGDNSIDVRVSGVANNSKLVERGDVFVAISGSKTDGALFAKEAVEKGAVAIFAEKPLPIELLPYSETPIFLVPDAYAAYARMAETLRGMPAKIMRLLGVTGTNGKTTTAFLLRSITRAWTNEPCGLISTVEYDTVANTVPADRTTPDAAEIQDLLAEILDNACRNAVIEVSSHALVQHRLGTAKFAAAVFTNLTGDHLDYHKTLDSYFEAKKTLFTEYLAPDGTAALNIDDPRGAKLADSLREDGIRTLTFGTAEAADFRITETKHSLAGLQFTLRLPNGDGLRVSSPLVGAFNAANIAGAAAAAFAVGATPSAIAAGISAMPGVPGRMERCGESNVFIDYAHTDDALENALSTIRSLLDLEGRNGKLIVLFGCGGDRDRSKRPRMGAAAARFADNIFVTSDNPRSETPSAIIAEILEGIPPQCDFEVIEERAEAIAAAVAAIRPGDALIIAGKGHETYQEVNGKRHPFDDRAIAAAALSSE